LFSQKVTTTNPLFAENSLGDYSIQITVESLTSVDSNYPVEDWWFLRLYRIYLGSISRKLKAYRVRQTLETVPGTNQYWAMCVKFLAQGNNRLPLTWFEPTRRAILRLLVQCVNHLAMPMLWWFFIMCLLLSVIWLNTCSNVTISNPTENLQ
jgi:hypothetical protein